VETVLITGSNRGIGLSLVKTFLAQGWRVFATYRDESSAHELLELDAHNMELTTFELDVTDYSDITKLADQLPKLDLLINNAGYYGPKSYSFGHTDVEQWRQVFEVNTIAPLKLVEALYPLLKNSQVKKIACISSKVGSMQENTSGGGYIYRSSKAALNSVVKSLSNDLKHEGITVLALHPGWVQTEMGGPNALIDTQTSALGLFKVINRAEIENSGQFINYDGTPIAW
jgi:NAD(P)-dependent dehydrogenase (short-subunit alcohol dehydrogenase family)